VASAVRPPGRQSGGRQGTPPALSVCRVVATLAGLSLERRRGWPCESDCCALIDAFLESVYIRTMPVGKIQVGQVWKKDDSGESYLITKIYNEAIATFALLRKTGAEAEGTIKIKVDQRGPSQALPGFTYTQESDQF
jgi:hypothetical protein